MALQATIRMRMIARPRTEQNMEENHVSELSDTSTGPTDQMSLGARLPELLLSKAPTPPREREVRGRDARVAPLSSQQGKGPCKPSRQTPFLTPMSTMATRIKTLQNNKAGDNTRPQDGGQESIRLEVYFRTGDTLKPNGNTLQWALHITKRVVDGQKDHF